MNNDNVGRVALLGLLGVIGAVAITKSGMDSGAGFNEGVIRWLLYAIACGLIVNTQDGKPFKIILFAASISALTLVSTISLKMLLIGGVSLSGTVIDFNVKTEFVLQLLVGLYVLSILAIIMSSYSRGILLSLLDNLFAIELSKAKKIEAILNRVVSIGAVFFIIIYTII